MNEKTSLSDVLEPTEEGRQRRAYSAPQLRSGPAFERVMGHSGACLEITDECEGEHRATCE